MEAGVDSLGATELQRALSEHLSTEFEATLLFDHPSIDSIVSCYTASGATPGGRCLLGQHCRKRSDNTGRSANQPGANNRGARDGVLAVIPCL